MTAISRLQRGTSGVLRKPRRILIHGPEGIGKSSLAASFPKPWFHATEDGTDALSVRRVRPDSWEDMIADVDSLANEKHDYLTYVLDSVDWAEPIATRQVEKEAGMKFEKIPYGGGYTAANGLWRGFTARLEKLRDKGMHIVLIAHTDVKKVSNLEGEDYERYVLKLSKSVGGLLREWVDLVAFAAPEKASREVDGKHKGVHTGRRLLHLEQHTIWEAKNRYGLYPTDIELSYSSLDAAIEEAVSRPERLERLLTTADAVTAAKIRGWLTAERTPAQIIEVVKKLETKTKEAA